MSIHIASKEDFESKLKDAGDQLIIVDFYATWCGPCKAIAPKLEELANEFSSSLIVLKVDVDECEEISTDYNINSMPTFVFIKNGKTISQFSGANYDKLKQIALENK